MSCKWYMQMVHACPPVLHCCVTCTAKVVAGGAVVGVLPSDRVLGLVPFHPGCGVSASPTPGLYEVSIPSFHAPPTIEVLPSWHTDPADLHFPGYLLRVVKMHRLFWPVMLSRQSKVVSLGNISNHQVPALHRDLGALHRFDPSKCSVSTNSLVILAPHARTVL